MICPKCNTPNDNNSKYCKQCALPLSEYYEATQSFRPSFSNQTIPEEEKKVQPVAEIKVQPQVPEKEKGSGIVWLLMWEMITWILWFILNDFVWGRVFKGQEPVDYINTQNVCSAVASLVAIIITLIVWIRTKRKREKIFLSIYFIVRIILMLIFAYRFYIDMFLR